MSSVTPPPITSYPGDPGLPGDPASWRTPEFLNSWGILGIGSEYAYAAGYAGAGSTVAVIDSGVFLGQPEVARTQPITCQGTPGTYDAVLNEPAGYHGTAMSGIVGALRDGNPDPLNLQGVAFNATMLMGNTRKGDGVYFGTPEPGQAEFRTLDQQYCASVYTTMAAQPGVRVVQSSWGSQPNTEQYQTLQPTTGPGLTGRLGLLGAWSWATTTDSWLQGALTVGRSGMMMTFSAGNSGYANPSPRAAATYFLPELEAAWLGCSGIQRTLLIGGVQCGQTFNSDGSVNVPGAQQYNQPGVAAWGCVTAPSSTMTICSLTLVNGVPTASYGSGGGTSSAAPHVAGTLAILTKRFTYMTNEQLVTVVKTTAIQNGTINDGGGNAIQNPTAGQRVQVPDARNGWGTISLRWAINGPAQFIGPTFAVDTQGVSDTWSNAITDIAIRARQAIDAAEAVVWNATKVTNGWTNGLPQGASAVTQTEYYTGMRREAARAARSYVGTMSKSGQGTLSLTGDNSYTGGTMVSGGTLSAGSRTALGTGPVAVAAGGTLATRSAVGVDVGPLTMVYGSTLDLGMSSSASGVRVAGAAQLGGTLVVTFQSGFPWGTTSAIDLVVSTVSMQGTFASFQTVGMWYGYIAQPAYYPDGVRLLIGPAPPRGRLPPPPVPEIPEDVSNYHYLGLKYRSRGRMRFWRYVYWEFIRSGPPDELVNQLL